MGVEGGEEESQSVLALSALLLGGAFRPLKAEARGGLLEEKDLEGWDVGVNFGWAFGKRK